MNSNRITVILGAGSTIEIGGPTTHEITEAAKATEQLFMRNRRFFIRETAEVLENYYGHQQSNFEDIFHALEQIKTYNAAWKNGTAKEFKPALGAFVTPCSSELFSDDIMINLAIADLLHCIGEMVYTYDETYLSNPENKWHTEFWSNLSTKSVLDIITLNYDTCLEKIIPSYNDGFENTDYEFKKFSPRKLFTDTEVTKIMHMHGCIHYGYSKTPDINQYILTSTHEELYCYFDYNKAN